MDANPACHQLSRENVFLLASSTEENLVQRDKFGRLVQRQPTVCVFSSHLFWTSSSLDVPAGVTQEEGHTGFLIHLPPAVHAFILSREGFSRSFPSSTVKSNFVYSRINPSPFVGHFFIYFLVRKNTSVTGILTHVPTRQKLRDYQLSCWGDRHSTRHEIQTATS